MPQVPLIAGIELGGTKVNCILASGPDRIEDEVRIPTTTPDETLSAVEAVLTKWSGFSALGIGSFGPISIDPTSPRYGCITSTPKPGWNGVDVVGRLRAHTRVAIGFHTDVTAAGMAEARWGAAEGLRDLAYVTVGTGIGVGLLMGGCPVNGLSHSELGHIRIPRLAGDDFVGICPFHINCVEGLASGPAIAARAGCSAEILSSDDPVWSVTAQSLAQLLHTLVLTGIPRRIVLGGGVMMGNPQLFPLIHNALIDSLAGYLTHTEIGNMDTFVVPPKFGNRAGPLGTIILGEQALRRSANNFAKLK